MAKYILLANWTDQGIRNIKGSAKRLDTGLALAKQQGLRLREFLHDYGQL